MRHYLTLTFIISLLCGCHSSALIDKNEHDLVFLFKTKWETSAENMGQHIEIKQTLPKTDELILMSIDDRDIISRSGYTRADEIRILGEYLSFKGDTARSNKKYVFKGAGHMTAPEDREGLTVQIEALYSFTRMLMKGYPPIKPVLINKETKQRLNTDPKIIEEVYAIYSAWFKESSKNDFKDISLPMDNSIYGWLGEETNIQLYRKKSL